MTGAATLARTAALTMLAMVAFAANSLLCRMALRPDLIDPATFGSVRVAAGAVALALMLRVGAPRAAVPPDWIAAAMLFAYVACFSFAYLSLSAGTGALILFGAVQATMLVAGLRGASGWSRRRAWAWRWRWAGCSTWCRPGSRRRHQSGRR